MFSSLLKIPVDQVKRIFYIRYLNVFHFVLNKYATAFYKLWNILLTHHNPDHKQFYKQMINV